MDRCKRVIQAAYFNAFDDNFIMNVQGANAFGVDLGLGSEKTYEKMVQYYKKLGNYDTGIFATDIVTRLLFERGDGELAFNLLVNNGDQGFEHWRRNGATTFHEYWDSNRSRSHNHPMFGAVVAYFFEYLLGKIALVLCLQVTAPAYFIFKFIVMLCQHCNGISISYSAKV